MVQLASILILGIFAQWFSWRVKIPAILPLIIVGLVVGPISSLFTVDGSKLLEVTDLFKGEHLFDFVSLAVGVILFEGGLTLKLKEIKELGRTLVLLLVFGTFITWFGAAYVAEYFLGLNHKIALLFGALVIVTGPTVIKPILKNVQPNAKISTILRWEGVLIDPIGAVAVVLIYEYMTSFHGSFQFFTLANLLLLIISGVMSGIGFAYLTIYLLKKKYIPRMLKNVILLALVTLCFAMSDYFFAESGLIAVTLYGFFLINFGGVELHEVISFKHDLTIILISVLFLVLSANINIEVIEMLGQESFYVLVIIMWVIRPVVIFLSSIGSNLTFKEQLFISWISPRGIVSAGIASIFSLKIQQNHEGFLSPEIVHDAVYLLPLTFMVIVGTVLIQGLTAKTVGRLLGVLKTEPNGIIFLGANDVTIFLANLIKKMDIPVLLSDTSVSNVKKADKNNVPTYHGSMLITEELENVDLAVYGQIWAMTSNPELNKLAVKLLKTTFGHEKVFRLINFKEQEKGYEARDLLFNGKMDFLQLANIVRDKPKVKMKMFSNRSELDEFLFTTYENEEEEDVTEIKTNLLPLFVRTYQGKVYPYTQNLENTIDTPFRLYYLQLIVKEHYIE